MELDKLTLGEIKQLQCMLGNSKKEEVCCDKDMGIRIVILQRGWVVVGRYKQSGDYVNLSSAYVVRKWGTTKGLPEIAIKGPLSDTVLDESPDMRFHILTEIASIKCEEDKWKKKVE